MEGLGDNVITNLLEYSIIILHFISLKPLMDAHTDIFFILFYFLYLSLTSEHKQIFDDLGTHE